MSPQNKVAFLLAAFSIIGFAASSSAADIPFEKIGSVAARHARDIRASNWSVGGETMDRDYTDYQHWGKYLGPLGAKRVRIQSGWAKTEKEKGVYDWDWVDAHIYDMVDQGVEPWVTLCYGNPIYPGGGTNRLGAKLPSTEEGLQAWERYVTAFVTRYKDIVDEWEIWNEPHDKNHYVPLFIRTAEVIREIQPDAHIIYAMFAGNLELGLNTLRDQKKLHLADEVSWHPYNPNPDSAFARAEPIRRQIESYAPHIKLFQGEQGAPAYGNGVGALNRHPWDETSQAKWNLRRIMGDLGMDIRSNLFTMIDVRYPQGFAPFGLLAANDGDLSVKHVRPAYYAAQHTYAIFDDTLTRIEDFDFKLRGGAEGASYQAFAYQNIAGEKVIALWRSSDAPGSKPEIETVVLDLSIQGFEQPVYVDLLSGHIYDFPTQNIKATDGGIVVSEFPIYDSVVLLAEQATVLRPDISESETAAIEQARTALARDDADTAATIFKRVLEHSGDRVNFANALQGLYEAAPAEALDRARAYIGSDDPKKRIAAHQLLGFNPGTEVTQTIVSILEKSEDPILLIRLLEARGDRSAAPALNRMATSTDSTLSRQAIAALSSTADADSIGLLIRLLDGPHGAIAETSLARAEEPTADAQLIEPLADANAGKTLRLIEILNARKSKAALPVMVDYLQPAQPAPLRKAALALIADIGGAAELPHICRSALAGGDPLQEAFIQAMRDISAAASDPTEALNVLQGCGEKAQTSEQKAIVMRGIASIGSPAALELIQRFLKSEDPLLQSTASELILNWPSKNALDAQFELVQAGVIDPIYLVPAVEGYLRLVEHPTMTDAEKVERYIELLEVCPNPETINMTLRAIDQYRLGGFSEKILPHLSQYLDDPATATAAAKTIVQLAQSLSFRYDTVAAPQLERIIGMQGVPAAIQNNAKRLLKKMESKR